MQFKDESTQNNVRSAMELWQAFEYLNPQKPPEPKLANKVCVWAVHQHSQGDTEMPWVNAIKQEDLADLFAVAPEKRRFVLYAGILPGRIYTNAARQMLGVEAIEDEESNAPGDAASLVLPIDSNGYVAGLPFVSSTPWALGSLAAAGARSERFNFSGFFGEFGAGRQATQALQELLVKWTLLPTQPAGEKSLTTVGDVLNRAHESKAAECEAKGMSQAETASALQKVTEEVRTQYRSVTAEDIRALTAHVFTLLGWTPSEEGQWIIETQHLSKKEMEDPLNSFYAEDIEHVQSAVDSGDFDTALKQFLSNTECAERIDLDQNKDVLIAGVHPSCLPLAAWPGSHPLVTAQQFAVNTIQRELAVSGIYSVNGPPGTGKTTMLKDIVAMVIQQRADKLMAFDKPSDAFSTKLHIENHKYPAYELDAALCGFGIVVTSANNGAVENISRELPGLGTIDKRIDLDYFSTVSDSLALDKGESRPPSAQTWGLISGALGNSSNRNLFAQNFWWGNKESQTLKGGSPNPLAAVSLQEWVKKHARTVPDWHQAKESYRLARQKADQTASAAADLVDMLRSHSELQSELSSLQSRAPGLRRVASESATVHQNATDQHTHCGNQFRSVQENRRLLLRLSDAANTCQQAQDERSTHQNSEFASASASGLMHALENATLEEVNAQTNFNNHLRQKPGALSRLIFRHSAKEWDRACKERESAIAQSQKSVSMARLAKRSHEEWLSRDQDLTIRLQKVAADWQVANDALVSAGFQPTQPLADIDAMCKASHQKWESAAAQAHAAKQLRETAEASLASHQAKLHAVKSALSRITPMLSQKNLLNSTRDAWRLHALERGEFHQTAPYQDDGALFTARRELFVAAMDLHKAFVVHAWRQLKPTLAAFIGLLQGQIKPGSIQGGPMPLWDAFFLTVPLVSTSFASFPRLFKGIGQSALAWTLIDEAGQATPQQALGAIWRSRRAVIVGDPIQLEPVVNIPQELVDPLKVYCGALDNYVPPGASVQTMADCSNRYGTLMGADDPATAIWLGSPLVVHRRCLDPMFGIANAIAYEDKMVYGTGNDPQFRAPPSAWLDADNNDAEGHWIASQGQKTMDLIAKLVGKEHRVNGKLRLYVITPFKLVSKRMQEQLAMVFGWDDAQQMCGTVHTFQGKEADFVIFLLGGDPCRPGVISSFAGRKPNLVNVAVTRAKKRLYVIGNKDYWCGPSDAKGYYNRMYSLLHPR